LVAAFVETGAQSDGLSETNEFDIEISDGRFATFGMAKDVGLNFDLGSEGDEKSCPWRGRCRCGAIEEDGTTGVPDEAVEIGGIAAYLAFMDFENGLGAGEVAGGERAGGGVARGGVGIAQHNNRNVWTHDDCDGRGIDGASEEADGLLG